jgi:hypothetical protein
MKSVLKPGTDGVKLLAVKFVETTILLFTPDPNVSPRPPPLQQSNDGRISDQSNNVTNNPGYKADF